MLIAIEGPDRSGKTTLLKPLAAALRATPITRLPTTKESVKCWQHVEPIYLHLLEQLMVPGAVYVTDRSMTVSAQVYSRVFDRPLLFDPAPWFDREVVVYVDTPLEVLRARWAEEDNGVFPADMYERTVEEYRRVLCSYRVVRVDGTAGVKRAVRQAVLGLGRLG